MATWTGGWEVESAPLDAIRELRQLVLRMIRELPASAPEWVAESVPTLRTELEHFVMLLEQREQQLVGRE